MKTIYSPNLIPGQDSVAVIIRLPQPFKRGGLAMAAEKVRKAGRYGDNMIVHMNKSEFEMLRRAWGEPTYHPDTGMPEYFGWSDIAGAVGDYFTNGSGWSDVLHAGMGALGGMLGKKSDAVQANLYPAPPTDPNLSTHLGTNATNARQAIPQPVEQPGSYYTHGNYPGTTPEKNYFKNNSLGAINYTPGTQVQPIKTPVPSTGQMVGGTLLGTAGNLLMKNSGKIADWAKNTFGGGRNVDMWPSDGSTSSLPDGAWSEAVPNAATDAASAAGAAGLTDMSGAAAANMAALPSMDMGITASSLTPAASSAAAAAPAAEAGSSAAGSGLGATLGGVGAAVGAAIALKHLSDNAAGLGYNESRQLAAGLAENAKNPDPTHGRGQYANTPLSPPPPGFKSWNQYFYATQMMQQSMHASGGAKDQGTYRMLLAEAGLPTDLSFYTQVHPGQEVAWGAIMGPQGMGMSSNSRGGRARGGLAMAEGGAVNEQYPGLPPGWNPDMPNTPQINGAATANARPAWMGGGLAGGSPYGWEWGAPGTGTVGDQRGGFGGPLGHPIYDQSGRMTGMTQAMNPQLAQVSAGNNAPGAGGAFGMAQPNTPGLQPQAPPLTGIGSPLNLGGFRPPQWGGGAPPPSVDPSQWGLQGGRVNTGGWKPPIPPGAPGGPPMFSSADIGIDGLSSTMRQFYNTHPDQAPPGFKGPSQGLTPAPGAPGGGNMIQNTGGLGGNMYGAGAGPASGATGAPTSPLSAPGGLTGNKLPPAPPPPIPPAMRPVPPPSARPAMPPPTQLGGALMNPKAYPGLVNFLGNQRAWMGGPEARATGGAIHGPGTGTSDDIPARLSNGEYVIPAHVVSALGDGSTLAGAKKLDELQKRVRLKVGKQLAHNRHPKPSPPPLDYINDLLAAQDMDKQTRGKP